MRRFWLAVACALATSAALAEGPAAPSETQVKAAFFYRFLSYVQWPSDRLPPGDSALVLGVIGSNEMFDEAARLVANRSEGTHPIRIRRLGVDDSLAGVHAVYIGSQFAPSLRSICQRAQAESVLAVSDADVALGSGCEISLVEVDGKVRFQVDLTAASRGGLKLGSGMLSVALKIVGNQ